MIESARHILLAAKTYEKATLKKRQSRLNDILKDPKGKACLVALLDQMFRPESSARVFEQIVYILNTHGIPSAFSWIEQQLLKGLMIFGGICPPISVFLFRSKLRQETRHLVLPLEKKAFSTHLKKRAKYNIKVNINLIGEDVIGEADASARLANYISLLKMPDVTYMSVKSSAILAHTLPLAFDESVQKLSDRLAILLGEAKSHTPHKFINMDMESYSDLPLSVTAFKQVMNLPEFLDLSAGIVIQTYLPDALTYLKDLCEWSEARISRGGVPIKVRLVKGANLEMERVIAERENIASPIYQSKLDVDANFKKMLHFMLEGDRMKLVHIGWASQNVFDIVYAWKHVKEKDLEDCFIFELLEGMSNSLAFYLGENLHQVLLYTPVVAEENFYYALSYLFRRLDENTGPENYLNYAASLPENTKNWNAMATAFLRSLDRSKSDELATTPFRKQNRAEEMKTVKQFDKEFKNTDTTDFALPQNLLWAKDIKTKWQHKKWEKPENLSWAQIEAAISIVKEGTFSWQTIGQDARHEILLNVAKEINKKRGDLIGQVAAETGKLFSEADVEITEAVDFALYYPYSCEKLKLSESVKTKPKGVVLVIAPWNFPIAIPLGGVISALATGNTVLLKPAPTAVATAQLLVNCCYDAGVPKSALQLVISKNTEDLSKLTASKNINTIVFTGSTKTGMHIKANARVPLLAETGGKNAMYISNLCDADLAVRNIIQSAFSNSGQKCSACAIVFLHQELAQSGVFLNKLKDAAESLNVGEPWDLSTDVGPMIENLPDKVVRAMVLDNAEKWLLTPNISKSNNKILSPGIKLNVRPDSFTFNTELFAPILSICIVKNIDEAIKHVNALPYGLTSGISSLDKRERDLWKDSVMAGNIYINRGITGAIVQRQPFGGMKASSIGVGIKAGGPNYVTQFLDYQNKETLSDISTVLSEYTTTFNTVFKTAEDVSQVYGEENILRYLPNDKIVYRISPEDDINTIKLIVHALRVTQNRIRISIPQENLPANIQDLLNSATDFEIIQEDIQTLLTRLNTIERLRFSDPVKDNTIRSAVAKSTATLIEHTPIYAGRIELLYYLNEQSVTYEYHRYGNVSSP